MTPCPTPRRAVDRVDIPTETRSAVISLARVLGGGALALAVAGSLGGCTLLAVCLGVSGCGSTVTEPTAPPPPGPPDASADSPYPWHTGIVATTFWVGEVFDPTASDGSQVYSTYDSLWMEHYGGCDGTTASGGCETEARTAANGYFPLEITPLENPFYLDLPFDDINDPAAFARRDTVVPWAGEAPYAEHSGDQGFSFLKNRWVELGHGGATCFAQIQDAGPGEYDDAEYVFGSADERPLNDRYGGAGMDVSPAVVGCLGFDELNGEQAGVSWRFVEESAVPAGPWLEVVTTSQVR
jgi:hypothetical protein